MSRVALIAFLTALSISFSAFAWPAIAADNAPAPSDPPLDTARGDAMLAEYFRQETAALADQSRRSVTTADAWQARKGAARQELFEMLGLAPLPAKTDLKPVITGRLDRPTFTVEKIHFQSRPGLYVTGNLYLPKELKGPAPTILYVCGHGKVAENGVSYGNKVSYQHHGIWFAQNGYVCLMIDTLQLGEIEGKHHGTYGVKQGNDWQHEWWWLCRGYTPAGVEAWNCIRALDYLETRPEVDAKRFGVTGRSGGGAYSWWIAALDDRIACAVPVAGITDLENHIVDGCVEGHCDCMFMVNTRRWDYAEVAALVAPRPLLISNTDKDRIFPLEGVVRVHQQVRDVYRLASAADKLGLQITEGPHKDTQELRCHAFRWFNRFLKNEDGLIVENAEDRSTKEELKVFAELPADEQNTRIQESFVPVAAPPVVPPNVEAFQQQAEAWKQALLKQTFAGWPQAPGELGVKEAFSVEKDGVMLSAYDFTSQGPIRLRLYLARPAKIEAKDLDLVVLNVLDDADWREFVAEMKVGFPESFTEEVNVPADAAAWEASRKMFAAQKWGMAYVAPRCVGPTACQPAERKQTQLRRRFMLLGQTLDGMQVFDIRRAVQAVRSLPGYDAPPLWLQSQRQMAGNTLYASLFEPNIHRLDLHDMPTTHRDGPYLLNVLKTLDLPAAVTLALEHSQVRLYYPQPTDGSYPSAVAKALSWPEKQFQIRGTAKKTE